MATPLSADALLATLKKWRVNYREYDGWKTRTRPGDSTPIGFIQHHTGGAFTTSMSYLEFLFVTGRPAEGIPGPLCNFAITADGVCWIGSRLRTNNAGAGDSDTREKVSSENYPGYTSELDPGVDDYSTGNRYYWGVEICYPGTVPMREAQYDTAVRLGAAIADAYGWSALSTLAHREHSSRKWDPGQMSLVQYRKDVRALLATPEEDDVTPEEIQQNVQIAIRPMAVRIETLFGEVKTLLAEEETKRRASAVRLEQLHAELKIEVDANEAKLDELLSRHPEEPAQTP